jgi:porphobilinogen deaminase
MRHGELWLRGLLASRDGSEVMRGEKSAPVADTAAADALGTILADEFLARGAGRLCGL